MWLCATGSCGAGADIEGGHHISQVCGHSLAARNQIKIRARIRILGVYAIFFTCRLQISSKYCYYPLGNEKKIKMESTTAYLGSEMESTLQYTALPDRAAREAENLFVSEGLVEERMKKLATVQPREADKDGDTETLDNVVFTHHFISVPGDYETVSFHYVEAGPKDGETTVFLHGIPDSWFQWHHQMSFLAGMGHRCIAPDLKGYGQSDKRTGDYRHEGAADQLFGMLKKVGLTKFNLVTHDRGTVQGDYIVAKYPNSVLRYGRGEQHLYNYNPVLSPQGEMFAEAPRTGMMDDPKRFVILLYTSIAIKPIPDAEMKRVIQEYSYPGINRAVPRYFNSSSFRAEWLDRRNRLLASWRCPVLIMQGYESKTQPREFYEDARTYIPNAKEVALHFLPGGHFWTLETPDETNEGLCKLLAMPL